MRESEGGRGPAGRGGCAGGGAAGEVPGAGGLCEGVGGSMAVPRGQEPTCPSLQHCPIVTGASAAAGAVWLIQASEGQPGPNPCPRPARLSQRRACFHSCWLRGGPEPPSMGRREKPITSACKSGPGIFRGCVRRAGLDWKGVLVTEQRCEGGSPRCSLREGLGLRC